MAHLRAVLMPARGPAPVEHARPSSAISTPVTATILTKDSARRIGDVLAALQWCDEVLVLDTGSTDETTSIARSFANVTLRELKGPFPGFGAVRRKCVALARNDWILSVDSDEVVSAELAAEIVSLRLDPGVIYNIPFRNHFNGRVVTTCGWFPDRHDRLFHRDATNFCASDVHETVQRGALRVQNLEGHIHHYSYEALDDFLRKMRAYARLYAAQHAGRKRSGPWTAVGHSMWTFLKCYVLQRGFLQGYVGFVISASNAQGTFWKYLLLHEANGNRS